MEESTLQTRWTKLDGEKGTLMSRCELYARWTLPYLFPPVTSNNTAELQGSNDSIGARCVNHLSNKVVTTLFRPQGAFFRLHFPEKEMRAVATLAGVTDEVEIAAGIEKLEAELNATEQEAMDELDMVEYRPNATQASKLLIVTGNALMYHPEDGPVQCYTVRDYCVVRDLSGVVIEIITKQCKAFETFLPDIQDKLRTPAKGATARDYQNHDDVTVYTQIKLEDDGKYHVYQQVDHVDMDTKDVFYPKDKLPWVVLTWNLARGENYGRGLVEEYAGAFHALEVYNGALINIAGVMGNIKFMVKPASVIDINEMNNSPPGSYHAGNPEDVAAVETNKQADAQFIQLMIEKQERNLSAAFLLNSSMTRDAERVTAEEIRMVANELELSNGGVYSRLALQWQVPTAWIILDAINWDGDKYGIKPKIITGMDSLSRQGEMDNLRLFVSDLALLEAVPEDIRVVIDGLKFAQMCATARQVDHKKFLKSQEQIAADQQAALDQQAQLEAQKSMGAVATEAGKQAVQQG
jgi:hypothetical protein